LSAGCEAAKSSKEKPVASIIGKRALDISGEDGDGRPFSLSDYRGKVVLLDFWATWWPPCRGMYPHERSLVQRLANKPFALLGVNGDGEGRSQAIAKTQEANINWRYWIDTPENPIVSRWEVRGYPTVFLIDQKGIVRYRHEGAPSGEELDAQIDRLLAESSQSPG
jgi:thiol-disulfide isomerase/thioredoxin